MTIRILLAEDQHLVRGALATLLDLESDLEVVVQVSLGEEVLSAALRERPDVAVLDVHLQGDKDGLTAAVELHEALPDCRTLILTGDSQPVTARRALDARVAGYIFKGCPSDQLADAVRAVASGRRVVDGELVAAAWESVQCPLTERETEVLRLASSGEGAVEISQKLFLSTGTVRNYLTSCVTKLNARNRVDAVRIAHDAGWL